MGRMKPRKGRFLVFSRQQSKFIARPHNWDSSEALSFWSIFSLAPTVRLLLHFQRGCHGEAERDKMYSEGHLVVGRGNASK